MAISNTYYPIEKPNNMSNAQFASLKEKATELEGVFLNTLMSEMVKASDTEGDFGGATPRKHGAVCWARNMPRTSLTMAAWAWRMISCATSFYHSNPLMRRAQQRSPTLPLYQERISNEPTSIKSANFGQKNHQCHFQVNLRRSAPRRVKH